MFLAFCCLDEGLVTGLDALHCQAKPSEKGRSIQAGLIDYWALHFALPQLLAEGASRHATRLSIHMTL